MSFVFLSWYLYTIHTAQVYYRITGECFDGIQLVLTVIFFILIFFEQQYILIFYTERAHEYSLYPPPTILATSGLRRSKLGQRPVYLKTVFWVFKGCCWILLWKATLTFRKCVYFSGLKKYEKLEKLNYLTSYKLNIFGLHEKFANYLNF
jgi:hypothetical protein